MLLEYFKKIKPENKDYNVFFKWLGLNLLSIALIGLAWLNGLVQLVVESDSTHIVMIIAGLTIVATIMSGIRALDISRRTVQSKAMSVASVNHKFYYRKLSFIRLLGTTAVLLGLIGTVLGFIITLSGVTPDTIGNVDQIGKLVSVLMNGMGVALYTTLIGAMANVLITFDLHILKHGTAEMIDEMES